MTYRNTLIERSRQFEALNEPVVLDYLQLRNRQCLDAWRRKRAAHARLGSTLRQGQQDIGIPGAIQAEGLILDGIAAGHVEA